MGFGKGLHPLWFIQSIGISTIKQSVFMDLVKFILFICFFAGPSIDFPDKWCDVHKTAHPFQVYGSQGCNLESWGYSNSFHRASIMDGQPTPL